MNSVVTYFYFSFADSTRQKYATFLTSTILQLCKTQTSIHHLQQLYEKYQPALPPTSVLEATIKSLIGGGADTFIVIDALDECMGDGNSAEHDEITQWLTEARNWNMSNLHLLVTSRKEPDIEAALVSLPGLVSVPLVKPNHLEDIRLYVSRTIERDRRLKTLGNDVKAEVEETLVTKSGGM